jgi:hypothetical protein
MCFMYLGFLKNAKQIVKCFYDKMRDTQIILDFLETHNFDWWAIDEIFYIHVLQFHHWIVMILHVPKHLYIVLWVCMLLFL